MHGPVSLCNCSWWHLLRLPCLWEQPMMNEALHCVQHSVPWVQTPYPFQLCNDYFDILKGLCRYHRDDMSCQDFCTVCWELFHPITQSVSSMWFLLSSTYMLYFFVFLFFVMISLIGNTIARVLLYSVDRKPHPFPLIVHYLYMSHGASTKTIYGFWRLWSMGFKLLDKHNFISLSNAPIFIYKWCRTRESL